MDWSSLIPLGASLLGGIFGGGQKTTTTSSNNSPELDSAAKALLERATGVYNKAYPTYTGQRVAAPTASREALTSFMPQVQNAYSQGLNTGNKSLGQIQQLMSIAPTSVSVPTLSINRGNNVKAQLNGGTYGGGSAASTPAFDINAFLNTQRTM